MKCLYFFDLTTFLENFPFVFGRIEDTRISFWNFLTFKDQDGKTALHLAATNGHSDTVSALIMNGADISSQDFVSLFIFSFFKLHTIFSYFFADRLFRVLVGAWLAQGEVLLIFSKEIQILLRLFLATMNSQTSSSQFIQSLNLPRC